MAAPPPAAALSAFPVDESFYPITLLGRLKALEHVQREAWEPLAGDLQVPHQFQVRDSVYVRHHHAGNLKPQWKGP